MSYDPSWHCVLGRAEEVHPWFEARAGLVASLVRRFSPHPSRILDAGCGTGFAAGRVAAENPGALTIGSDLSIAEASESGRAGVILVAADLSAMPFAGCFDVVMLLDVMEHFEDDRRVLRSTRSALAEGGLLALTVPALPALWSGYDEMCGHVRRYTRRSLGAVLASEGFEILALSYFMCLLAPGLLLRRRLLAPGSGSRRSDFSAEFTPGRLASALLSASAAVERRLIESGASLPPGSSLVALARSGGH